MNRSAKATQTVPVRLGLSCQEAAQSLGVSEDFFAEHILPELRIVRRGRRRIVPYAELQRWLSQAAALTLEVA